MDRILKDILSLHHSMIDHCLSHQQPISPKFGFDFNFDYCSPHHRIALLNSPSELNIINLFRIQGLLCLINNPHNLRSQYPFDLSCLIEGHAILYLPKLLFNTNYFFQFILFFAYQNYLFDLILFHLKF